MLMLAAENRASYGYRYSHMEEVAGEIDEAKAETITYIANMAIPVATRAAELFAPGGLAHYDRARHDAAAAVVKALDCYVYQSCEHNGWEDSEARLLVAAARSHFAGRIEDRAPVRDQTNAVSGWPVEPVTLRLWLAGNFSAADDTKARYGR